MSYSLVDAGATVVAAALGIPILVLPGYAIGATADFLGFRNKTLPAQLAVALLLAHAILPVTDVLVARFVGVYSALLLNLGLAVAGLIVLLRTGRWKTMRLAFPIAGLAWLALLIVAWIDLDWQGQLYQSLLMDDGVKHAATVRALVDTGVPPLDPFFQRDGLVGYYYFYYVPSALVEILGGTQVDPRAAFFGLSFWTALAFTALIALLYRRTGLAGSEGVTRQLPLSLILALLLTTGLDILPVFIGGVLTGQWLPFLEWWNEEVSSWMTSLLWVPHHIAALIAFWTGCLAIAIPLRQREGGDDRTGPTAILIAAAAFASTVGLSIWVALAAVATCLLWSWLLGRERRWHALTALVTAAVASGILLIPHLIDIIGNRAYDTFPIAYTIRAFKPWDELSFVQDRVFLLFFGRLALLPLNYLLEFGVFLLGTVVFWHRSRCADVHRNELARIVTIGGITGLVLGTFLKSTIINNDLGWRTLLFPQLAALLWTLAVLGSWRNAGVKWSVGTGEHRLVFSCAVLMLLGYIGNIYSLVALRTNSGSLEIDPGGMREVRQVYEQLNTSLPQNTVIQHNPSVKQALAFGLYGRFPVAISDRYNARLFGASEAEARTRLENLSPIFGTALPVREVQERARRYRIDYLLVTAEDPVWYKKRSWVWISHPLVATDFVRILSVPALFDSTSENRK